jgi:hypothetical protein
MRAKAVASIALAAGIVIMFAAAAYSQEKISGAQWSQVVEKIGEKGKINWSDGYIEAVGIGAPPEHLYGKPNARPMALRAATVDAQRNLLEIMQGVRIDSATSVRDFTVESDVIKSQVEGMVRGAQMVSKDYLSDGTVEVTLRVPMAGSFSQIIIPKVMENQASKPVPPAAAAPPPPPPPAPPAPEAASAPAPPAATPGAAPVTAPPAAPVAAAPTPPAVYTGLVVDARGIQARPAMSPRIIDEEGKEIYGTANVERDYAVQQGMVGYARDLTAAQSNPRVTNSPLSIKGLKTQGAGRADIIVGAADAQAIRSGAENQAFLKKCRVMIVLD